MSKFHQINGTFGEAREIPDVPPTVEIHCTANPEFTKKYGKAVKRLGGKYDSVRGNQEIRFVKVPADTLKGIELINAIVADFGKIRGWRQKDNAPLVTLIARGATGAGPAWLDVQHIPKRGEDRGGDTVFEAFVKKYQRALERAAEDKIAGIGKGPIPASYYAERAAQRKKQLEGRIAHHKGELAKAEAELAKLNEAGKPCPADTREDVPPHVWSVKQALKEGASTLTEAAEITGVSEDDLRAAWHYVRHGHRWAS